MTDSIQVAVPNVRVAALAVAAVLNVLLAALLVMRGAIRRPEVAVPALAVALAGWSGAVCLALVADTPEGIRYWTRASFFAGSWVLYAIGLIGLWVPYPSAWARRGVVAGLAAIPAGFTALSMTSAMVVSSARLETHVNSVYGWAQLPFTLYALATVLGTLSLLAVKYRASSYSQRLRIRFFALGVIAVGVVGTLTNAVLPRLGVTGLNQVGPLTSVLFAMLTAYSIVRHRLLDLDVVLRKGLVYSALVGFVSVVAVAGLFVAQQRWGGALSVPVSAVLVATVIVFALVPLRDRLDRWTARLFGGGEDPARLLRAVTERFSRVEDSQAALDDALDGIRQAFGSDDIRLYVRQGGSGVHALASGKRLPADGQVDPADPLCRAIFETLEPATRDEAAARARQQESPTDSGIRDSLDARQSEVAVPILRGGEPAGILMLGRKTSGKAFRNRELALASAVAGELAIVLENRKLLEEVRIRDRRGVISSVATELAHEINNPLTGMDMYVQLLAESWGDPTKAEQVKHVGRLLSDQSQRSQRMVKNLLHLASPRSPVLEPVAIHTVVGDMLALQAKPLERQGIVLRVIEERRSTVLGDAGYLSQVFLNLVLNAKQSMLSGGELTVRIAVEGEGSGSVSRVDVSDTGVGIPPEKVPMIFEPFYTSRADGSGLGLASVRRIVSEHKGSIEVESEVGKGTTFTVRLPAV